MNYKALALILLALIQAYKLTLLAIKRKSFSNPIPENVKDIYDEEKFQKWRMYSAEKSRWELWQTLSSFVITFLLILTDAFSAFSKLFGTNIYWRSLGVTLLTVITDTVTGCVFGYVDSMIVEQKYGFNKTTKATFIADQVKGLVISLILSLGLTALLATFHLWLGKLMPVVFAAALFLFILFITFLYPFFSRIFNKFTPLEDGELKDKLTGLLEKNGYRVRAIQVMDASRRSSKSNAYFTGFGKTKTIVLFDTLVASSTPDEICAVFAHEMGHGIHKDTLKNQALSLLNVCLIALCAYLTVSCAELYKPFGFDSVNYGFAMVLVGEIELAIISPLLGLFSAWHSRRAEFRADRQAVVEGYGKDLISALKTLARENFSHLAPSPLIVKLEYSHPPLSERIKAIEEGMKQN
ncbi:MAG: M48 family metallopeptidase [Clostridia bacterium]|nr:M48 family metallopeptidase [Clostridia bacterium]